MWLVPSLLVPPFPTNPRYRPCSLPPGQHGFGPAGPEDRTRGAAPHYASTCTCAVLTLPPCGPAPSRFPIVSSAQQQRHERPGPSGEQETAETEWMSDLPEARCEVRTRAPAQSRRTDLALPAAFPALFFSCAQEREGAVSRTALHPRSTANCRPRQRAVSRSLRTGEGEEAGTVPRRKWAQGKGAGSAGIPSRLGKLGRDKPQGSAGNNLI